jgi:hypothetical protein
VQAAEFLGCEKIQKDIVTYLQMILIETIERTEKSIALQGTFLDMDRSLEVHHAYGHDWHNLQVCACNLRLILSGL